MDGFAMKKWELSLLIAVAVTILYAAMSEPMPHWWTAAFSPLCDGILTADADGTGMVLRSKICELVTKILS